MWCMGAWWVVAATLVTRCGWARELDPAACAARFDVQRDKIIRTEESRDMGARYLSELDVGARHECRRLCCETDACDVFVYEEKSPGSCYLFNCGPPEDFRCKFTAHSNFSSGVLALSRRLAELQDQERLARPPPPAPDPPAALSSLSRGGSATSGPPASTPPPAPAPAPAPPPPPPLLPAQRPRPSDPPAPLRRCSRYQFECHSGGECIAVYNACDGVPQCADGSDEAPELGCPAPAPPAPPPARSAPPSLAPAPSAAHPPRPAQESPDFEPLGGGAEAAEASGARATGTGERWPHRLTQAQHRYSGARAGAGGEVSSHIFSHKGGLLQEPEGAGVGAGAPQYAYEAPPAPVAWPRQPWPPHRSGAEGMSGGGWGGGGYGAGWGEGEARRAWPVPERVPEPVPERVPPERMPEREVDAEMPMYLAPKTMPELPMLYASQQHTLRDAPKKGLGLREPPAPAAPAPPPRAPPPAAAPPPPAPPVAPPAAPDPALDNTTKKKALPDKAAASAGADGSGADPGAGAAAAHVLGAADAGDGLSERPPAAVLLLVLGMGMTGAMGTMLACRARAARRRLRRGHKPFAHDADYLVNGMYL